MTDTLKIKLPAHDPIASTLSAADDRIVLSHWLPPQQGIVPRIRIGRRWINILWAIPIGAAALVLLVALAQSLRELPSVQAFIKAYLVSRRPRPRSIPAFRGGCSCSTS
jgi:methionine sulfoxide reductase catalytic subunit